MEKLELKTALQGLINLLDSKGRLNKKYSTTEQVVGTWIDGKPIYRKVYSGTLESGTHQPFDLTTLNIDTMVNLNPMMHTTDKSAFIPIPAITDISGTLYYTSFWYSNKQIWTACSLSSWNGRKFNLIIEYTKTTD